jgi:hypothetical protein
MRFVREYIAALWKGWIGAMSSSASLVFLLLGLSLNLTQGFQRRYWLIASFTCYVIASFMAWFRIRPDLSVEIQSVSTQPFSFGWSDLEQLRSLVIIKLYVVNTRPANNSIKQYRFVIKSTDKEFVSERFSLNGYALRGIYEDLKDLGTLRHGTLKQGEPLEGYLCFIHSVDPRAHKAVLSITDAYNVSRNLSLTIPAESEDVLVRHLPDAAFRDLL